MTKSFAASEEGRIPAKRDVINVGNTKVNPLGSSGRSSKLWTKQAPAAHPKYLHIRAHTACSEEERLTTTCGFHFCGSGIRALFELASKRYMQALPHFKRIDVAISTIWWLIVRPFAMEDIYRFHRQATDFCRKRSSTASVRDSHIFYLAGVRKRACRGPCPNPLHSTCPALLIRSAASILKNETGVGASAEGLTNFLPFIKLNVQIRHRSYLRTRG